MDVYTNTDNNVVSAYESLVKVGQDAKIPLVARHRQRQARRHCRPGINYRDLGADRAHGGAHPEGRKPGDIA